MIEKIKDFVKNNSVLLFKFNDENSLITIFDEKGFFFSKESESKYASVKNSAHLYVAFTRSKQGNYYIGKSFQKGGRWKRQHAYHLGTLAYHLLNTTRYDDQNHRHWIDNWLNVDLIRLDHKPFTIGLKEEVYIAFIPFEIYSKKDINELTREEVRKINSRMEENLIRSYINDGFHLLNIHHNK